MNPKAVIAKIEKTRAVMQAQLEKISDVPSRAVRVLPGESSTSGITARIVDAAFAAQMSTAVDWLCAASEVEASFSTTTSSQAAPPSAVVELKASEFKELKS